jgi:dUTP pyrophosphatase
MNQPVVPASREIRVVVCRAPEAQDLPYPAYMTPDAAGADIHAAVTGEVIVRMGEIHRIPTGISLEIPKGFECQVRARSGLALQRGLALVNAPGTIDSDYRGELKVILQNGGADPVTIARGDRIAQVVFARYEAPELVDATALEESSRGPGGFGSTGI